MPVTTPIHINNEPQPEETEVLAEKMLAIVSGCHPDYQNAILSLLIEKVVAARRKELQSLSNNMEQINVCFNDTAKSITQLEEIIKTSFGA